MDLDPTAGKIIFVVGNSRSGTTMLGKILGRHSNVHSFQELQVFEKDVAVDDMSRRILPKEKLVGIGERIYTSIDLDVFSNVERGRYRDHTERLISRLGITDAMALYAAIVFEKAASMGSSIPCEQTPRYLFVLQELLAAFPDARVVHIYRDPRAVLLSQKNRWKRASLSSVRPVDSRLWTLTSWSNYHPWITMRIWMSATKRISQFASHPRVLNLRYETLLDNPRETLTHVSQFLGLAFEEEMLNVPVEGSSTRQDAPRQSGIDSSRIDDWKNGGLTNAEIAISEGLTRERMVELGYEPSNIASGSISRLLVYSTLFPKLVLALAFNFRRFRNIPSYLKARLL